jgi:hypothetical protein
VEERGVGIEMAHDEAIAIDLQVGEAVDRFGKDFAIGFLEFPAWRRKWRRVEAAI